MYLVLDILVPTYFFTILIQQNILKKNNTIKSCIVLQWLLGHFLYFFIQGFQTQSHSRMRRSAQFEVKKAVQATSSSEKSADYTTYYINN
jgi:hypothetical protein